MHLQTSIWRWVIWWTSYHTISLHELIKFTGNNKLSTISLKLSVQEVCNTKTDISRYLLFLMLSLVPFQLLPATTIKNIFPRTGHAKLIWTRCHSFNGQIHGCTGAWGGACFTDWHSWHDFPNRYLVLPTTCDFLLKLSFLIFLCVHCNSCKSLGIITRIPHSRHLSSTESSFQNFITMQLKNGCFHATACKATKTVLLVI